MKLLERYATACGLDLKDIGSQFLIEQFYPLPFDKYITLHASSGMQAKNYSYWNEVVAMLKPYLAPRGIEIVQLGVKEDPAVPGCFHTMGKTTEHQASYILSRSLCHCGSDSVWAHRAGHQNIPIVELFGSTSEANHAPYIYNKEKSIFLSSHRNGRNPTFSAQESPKSIDLIDPFEIARSILRLLDIPHTLTQRTQCIGPAFTGSVLDFIPNVPLNPAFNPEAPTAVRMDILHNEEILVQVLQSGRKVNIVTKKPINPEILRAFAPNILAYHHELDADCPVPYLKAVMKLIPNRTFFTRSRAEDEVAALRFKFFDVVQVKQITNKTKDDYEKAVREYLNRPDFSLDKEGSLDKLVFKTNKFVLSRGKIYLSLAHERADKPIEGTSPIGQIIDDPDFWCDAVHFMTFIP